MFENLSQEILDQVKKAKTKEEALELLKQNGIELSEDDLNNVDGGGGVTCLPFILDPERPDDREYCPLHNAPSPGAPEEGTVSEPFCGRIWAPV